MIPLKPTNNIGFAPAPGQKRATRGLRQDHDTIKKVLKATEICVDMLKKGQEIPAEVLKDAVDFILNFTDRCHHSKEEDGLFPALGSSGMSRDGGPIAVMLREHDIARDLGDKIANSVKNYTNLQNDDTKMALISSCQNYLDLLYSHLHKENNILFNMADATLDGKADETESKMEKIQQEKLGDKHNYYTRMAESLLKKMGG